MNRATPLPRCADCDTELPRGGSSDGLCMRCAFELALDAEPPAPERIGHYRILEPLGGGGMGVVYLAEQERPVRRRVALKLVRPGIASRQVMARFESERQALALMSHPNIAHVFDAGTAEGGRPFFAMELVEGRPITEYCDERRLGVPERLRLFVRVCRGVQHAHQKGIIHRDLKSSNVLVRLEGEQAVPKIIDFGVAKTIDRVRTGRTLQTWAGQMIGTPAYMSPEQAGSNTDDVDTRTDVYALGVLLYELVVGVLPLDPRDTPDASLQEVCRRICEDPPPRPSRRVAELGTAAAEIALRRRTDPEALARRLRGDLDWVLMRALEKDPARRYASPDSLAADVERHLDDRPVEAGPPRPVEAGPPTVRYRAGKFVRRYRVAVGTAACVAALLLAFAVVMTVQAARIARERDRANEQAAAHREVAELLKDIFKVSDPGEAAGETITAREILDRGLERVTASLVEQPLTRADLMATMGEVYDNLGVYDQAQRLLEGAARSHREIVGPEDPRTLRSRTALGEVYRHVGRFDESEDIHRDVLATRRALLGNDHPDTAESLTALSWTLSDRGRFDEAERLADEALRIVRDTFGERHARFLEVSSRLGTIYRSQGRYADAERVHREALDVASDLLGPNDPRTLTLVHALGFSVWRQSRFEEAERLFVDLVERRSRVLGPEHPSTIATMNNLAGVYFTQGRLDDAAAAYEQVLDLSRRSLGEDHPDTIRALNNLGMTYSNLGRLADAERVGSEALAARRRILGPDNPETLSSMNNLAQTYLGQGRYELAERLHRETLELRRRVLGAEHPDTMWSLQGVASALAELGRLDEALELHRRALEIRRRTLGDDHWDTLWSIHLTGRILARLGRADEAEALLSEAVVRAQGQLGPDHPDTLRFRTVLRDFRGSR
jgi:non-specific serine/threonine protein kinase/serine/threonine-protein kinase